MSEKQRKPIYKCEISFPDITGKQKLLYDATLSMLSELGGRKTDTKERKKAYGSFLPKKLYKYCTNNERSILSIVNQNVFFSNVEDLNDPLDGKIFDLLFDEKKKVIDFCRKTLEYYKIPKVAGFSKNYKNNLLWVHYANEHRGICIEYDYEALFRDGFSVSPPLLALPVFYTNYFDVIKNALTIGNGCFSASNLDSYITFLLKSKKWKYEEEIRILSFADKTLNAYSSLDNNYFYRIPISSIYLGVRFDKNTIFYTQLETACERNNIPMKQMKYNYPQKGKGISLYTE